MSFCFFFLLLMTGSGRAEEGTNDVLFKHQTQSQEAIIEKVISAELIVLENGQRIRLIGIRAPELPRKPPLELEESSDSNDNMFAPNAFDKTAIKMFQEEEPLVDPVVPVEQKSLDTAKALMEGKKVRLEFDKQKNGDDLITFAYVFLRDDNLFVNAELVRLGMAYLQIRPPNTKYADRLREAYQEARRELRGLQGQ